MINIKALLANQPNVRFDISEKALANWQPQLRVNNSESGSDNNINILEAIGEDYWGSGVSSRRIDSQLRAIGRDKPVTININSPGGDVFEGLAIYSLLKEHRGHVTVKVIGLAASAASIITMAGDTVQIAKAGFLMIHNCWTVAAGDRHRMAEMGEWLAPFDDAMAGIYEDRTGEKKAELAALMDKETWINSDTAISQGYADELLSSDSVSALASAERSELIAVRKIDVALAKAGMTRAERRGLLQDFKAGTHDAAGEGTPGATSEPADSHVGLNLQFGSLAGLSAELTNSLRV
jgi:ATP-dependent protease ClpP protease subunit